MIPTKMVNTLKLCKQSFTLCYIEVRTHLKTFDPQKLFLGGGRAADFLII